MNDKIHPPYLATEVPMTWGGQHAYYMEIERYQKFLTWSDEELQKVIDRPTGASAETARHILRVRKAST